MQGLILAAGRGSRLNLDIPKPFLKIGRKTIIENLITNLRCLDIDEIAVVTGFKREIIEPALELLKVKYYYNPIYHRSDTLFSFWIGGKFINYDCLVLYADLIFERKLLDLIMSSRVEIVLLYDKSSLDEEAMKIELAGARVANFSKLIPLADAMGELIPIYKFKHNAAKKLIEICGNMLIAGGIARPLEDPILKLLKTEQFSYEMLDATGLKWAEIDTQEDYSNALKVFERSQ